MGSRNLEKWFRNDLENADYIAVVYYGLTSGNSHELNTHTFNKFPPSVWYDLSREIFGSTDTVHRLRLYNLWLDDRKGIQVHILLQR